MVYKKVILDNSKSEESSVLDLLDLREFISHIPLKFKYSRKIFIAFT